MTNSTSDCPFCLENHLLNGPVVAETDTGFIMRLQQDKPNYLIIPKSHAETLADLPDNWWHHFKTLLHLLPQPLPSDYNLSLNIGKQAGQSVRHLHFWIIPRSAGRPDSGKGVAQLIDESGRE